MKRIFFSILLLGMSMVSIAQKFNNLALKPQMGWNSWNTFGTEISEQMIMEIADAMVNTGLKDAGYEYILLDDGWMAMERDAKGNLAFRGNAEAVRVGLFDRQGSIAINRSAVSISLERL
jgi:alpha-galactosidase